MARKTIITVLVLAGVLALLYWYQQSRQADEPGEDAVLRVTVQNQTKDQDGTAVTAGPLDVLVYTLSVENPTDQTIAGYVVEANINDTSELATLIDAAGANYNAATNSLVWTPLDVPAYGSIQKQFSVRVKESIPSGSGQSMTVAFGNQVDVQVSATAATPAPAPTPTPAAAPATGPAYAAPTTGPSLWFIALMSLVFTFGIILYKAAKSIQV